MENKASVIGVTAAIGFGAGAALVVMTSVFNSAEAPVTVQPPAVPQPVVTSLYPEADMAVENAAVAEMAVAETAFPQTTVINETQMLEALQTARAAMPGGTSAEDQAVTRDAPADLLQLAPMARPEPQPAPETAQADPVTTADFFNNAQANLDAGDTCGDDLRALANGARVYFPSGGLSGGDSGLVGARLVAKVAADCPGYSVQVEGHSDPSGDPAINLRLSKQRAEAVIQRLGSAGIDVSKLVAVGYGDTRPSGVTGSQPAAFYDRRVEFTVIEDSRQANLGGSFALATTQAAPVPACVRELQQVASQSSIFFSDRAITVAPNEIQTARNLAERTLACDGARLRLMGHYSDAPGSRETFKTARLRSLAMMSSLVADGIESSRIIVGAASESTGVPGQPGLPKGRIDFQIIMD